MTSQIHPIDDEDLFSVFSGGSPLSTVSVHTDKVLLLLHNLSARAWITSIPPIRLEFLGEDPLKTLPHSDFDLIRATACVS